MYFVSQQMRTAFFSVSFVEALFYCAEKNLEGKAMKHTKRFFAVLLAVVLLLGVVPVMNVGMTASAANGVKGKPDRV